MARRSETTGTPPPRWSASGFRRVAAQGLALLAVQGCAPEPGPSLPPLSRPVAAPAVATEIEAKVRAFCGACHEYPPPESFPRGHWPAEVHRGFEFYRQSDLSLDPPSETSVTAFYAGRAPSEFPTVPRTPDRPGLASRFVRREIAGPRSPRPSAIGHVGRGRSPRGLRPEILACDMAHGDLLRLAPGDRDGPLMKLATGLGHPARVEAVDLDGDGRDDLIVADLGVPMPADDRLGRVLWLRAEANGSLETIILADGLGRVADVQAADFDGDGDLDLIVAVFGWRRVGEILLLEQRPGPDGQPTFARRTLDPRHGAIHVPVADLDRDGRPDFVALISQEHEVVSAFFNRGGGTFREQVLFRGPHPAYGSSGITLVDLDGDGDLDVLWTNGDVYDSPMLKPYHGVSWLENRGLDRLFVQHLLGPLYGAHRAIAGDLDGDGDLDVVASSFLAAPYYAGLRREVEADALVIFEQVEPGRFVRHALEREACDYPSLAVCDPDGDGDLDLVVGRFLDFSFSGADPDTLSGRETAPIVLWENRGTPGLSRRDGADQGRPDGDPASSLVSDVERR